MSRDDEERAFRAMEAAAPRLDRIVEQLQGIHVSVESLRVSLTAVSQISDDHEVRVRRLESWTHRVTPWMTLVTFVAGIAVTTLVESLFR